MKALIAIVAVLASATASTSAQSQPFRLECLGTGKSQGYPYGAQETGETRYRIEIDGKQISVLHRGSEDRKICPTGAACTVVATDHLVQVQVYNVLNADPLYSTRFRLERNSLKFEASGGGLDGGWLITGRCKPERS